MEIYSSNFANKWIKIVESRRQIPEREEPENSETETDDDRDDVDSVLRQPLQPGLPLPEVRLWVPRRQPICTPGRTGPHVLLSCTTWRTVHLAMARGGGWGGGGGGEVGWGRGREESTSRRWISRLGIYGFCDGKWGAKCLFRLFPLQLIVTGEISDRFVYLGNHSWKINVISSLNQMEWLWKAVSGTFFVSWVRSWELTEKRLLNSELFNLI
jgi:hypothetical protein